MDNQTKFVAEKRVLLNVCKNINRGNINLSPSWQRNVVWNKRMQQDLISTILKGFPINPVVFWRTEKDNKEVCVDGKNRLSAINDFVNNKFMVSFQGKEISYKDLTEEKRESFDDENLDIRVLVGSYWNETRIREYFQVIQGGCKLTWPEIINAFNNSFVDCMRELMVSTQEEFYKVLGDDCNNRFELYNIVANIISVHPHVYSKYKTTNKTKRRTADTNKSLMKYVTNFDDFELKDGEQECLKCFIIDTVDIIASLQKMQREKVSPNRSIWFLSETESNSARIKPGIRDFTSVAYYIVLNPTKTKKAIKNELKKVFTKFVTASLNPSEHKDVLPLIRDYYITNGKNQKQYAWASVSARYDIMQQVLKMATTPLIDL